MSKIRNDKESMICFTPNQAKVSLFNVYKAKKKYFTKRL